MENGVRVTVISPMLLPEFQLIVNTKRIRLIPKDYRSGNLSGAGFGSSIKKLALSS
jgi:hypothetical protein